MFKLCSPNVEEGVAYRNAEIKIKRPSKGSGDYPQFTRESVKTSFFIPAFKS